MAEIKLDLYDDLRACVVANIANLNGVKKNFNYELDYFKVDSRQFFEKYGNKISPVDFKMVHVFFSAKTSTGKELNKDLLKDVEFDGKNYYLNQKQFAELFYGDNKKLFTIVKDIQDTTASVQLSSKGVNSIDFAKDVFIFNTMGIKNDGEAIYVLDENLRPKEIKNFNISIENDNFDYKGGEGTKAINYILNKFYPNTVETELKFDNYAKTYNINFNEYKMIEKLTYNEIIKYKYYLVGFVNILFVDSCNLPHEITTSTIEAGLSNITEKLDIQNIKSITISDSSAIQIIQNKDFITINTDNNSTLSDEDLFNLALFSGANKASINNVKYDIKQLDNDTLKDIIDYIPSKSFMLTNIKILVGEEILLGDNKKYVVKQGDTIIDIAKANKMSVKSLIKLNPNLIEQGRVKFLEDKVLVEANGDLAKIFDYKDFVSNTFGNALKEDFNGDFKNSLYKNKTLNIFYNPTAKVIKYDPLVLDLNNNGAIDTITLDNSKAFFDHNNDNIAYKSSWISKDDGLLVLDKNNTIQVYL